MIVRKRFGVLVTSIWLVAMSALVARDVLPAWRAKPMPPVATRQMVDLLGGDHQMGIYDGKGRRIGTTWSSYLAGSGLLVTTTTAFSKAGLLSGCLINTQVRFSEADVLDEFEMKLLGPGVSLELRGENYAPHFPCELKIGTKVHRFKLASKMAGLLSDVIRPFYSLPELRVGDSWTIEVVDLLGALRRGKADIRPMLVKVTGREKIEVGGRLVDCFVLETTRVRAWADENGLVLMQEMDLPLLGRMMLRSEPFAEETRRAARIRLRELSE